MTDEELKKLRKEMRTFTKETCKSKERAIAFLQDAGIMNKKGKLAEEYGGEIEKHGRVVQLEER